MDIVWSPTAEGDILAIQEYIARDSPARAIGFANRLIASVDRLARFPNSGRPVVNHPGFREIVFRGYRVVYQVFPSRIEIETVFGPGQTMHPGLDDG